MTTGTAPVVDRPDHRQFLRLFADRPCRPELEGRLQPVTVAYETWGTLNAAGDNAVLLCHALTGDAHAASHDPDDAPGWWEGAVGPARPIDTGRWFVVCANVLGGCAGSTGPAELNPKTGRPFGMGFPRVTIRDMVAVQRELLRRLGVRRLQLVAGGSMGGMQALEWAVMYPDLVGCAAVIGAPAATSPQSIAWNEVGRRAVLLDPTQGLAVARMLAMITYNSYESLQRKFGRDQVDEATDPVRQRLGPYGTELPLDHPFRMTFQVESYLHYQGEKLVRRFDPLSYLYLTRAMDMHAVGRGRGGVIEALSGVRASILALGIDSDILYPLREQQDLVEACLQAGVEARLEVLPSPWGHDAFLIEAERAAELVVGFMRR